MRCSQQQVGGMGERRGEGILLAFSILFAFTKIILLDELSTISLEFRVLLCSTKAIRIDTLIFFTCFLQKKYPTLCIILLSQCRNAEICWNKQMFFSGTVLAGVFSPLFCVWMIQINKLLFNFFHVSFQETCEFSAILRVLHVAKTGGKFFKS